MLARAWWSTILVAATAATAAAEPKPKPVDIKPFRERLIVLADARGGVYAVDPGSDGRVFYGTKTKLYEQVAWGRSRDRSTGTWSVSTWAPRVPETRPGSVTRKKDGTYARFCGEEETGLSPLSTEDANRVLDKAAFFTTAAVRRPHLLARDDAGVYYYVDSIRKEYGGKGYRVFVGKKGAMKQRPLTDVATDSAGEVFATKTGDLRIVREAGNSDRASNVIWVRGGKRTSLYVLDTEVNSPLIFKDLGVYTFIGSICDHL
jgi:hypothetical protein